MGIGLPKGFYKVYRQTIYKAPITVTTQPENVLERALKEPGKDSFKATLNPKPKTQNPKPKTLNPKPCHRKLGSCFYASLLKIVRNYQMRV